MAAVRDPGARNSDVSAPRRIDGLPGDRRQPPFVRGPAEGRAVAPERPRPGDRPLSDDEGPRAGGGGLAADRPVRPGRAGPRPRPAAGPSNRLPGVRRPGRPKRRFSWSHEASSAIPASISSMQPKWRRGPRRPAVLFADLRASAAVPECRDPAPAASRRCPFPNTTNSRGGWPRPGSRSIFSTPPGRPTSRQPSRGAASATAPLK